MIPKKIHYCWFGNDKPQDIINRIESWKKILPDFSFIEWNESNINLETLPAYAKQALKHKKWAFVTDYVRLKALSTHGGIYLDTDVDIIKSFDHLLESDFFIGQESLETLCTAVIGSSPSHEVITNLLTMYETIGFEKRNGFDLTPNSIRMRRFIINTYQLYKISSNVCEFMPNAFILPIEVFSPKNLYTGKVKVTDQTITIHQFTGLWKQKGLKWKIMRIAYVLLGEKIFIKVKSLYKRGR